MQKGQQRENKTGNRKRDGYFTLYWSNFDSSNGLSSSLSTAYIRLIKSENNARGRGSEGTHSILQHQVFEFFHVLLILSKSILKSLFRWRNWEGGSKLTGVKVADIKKVWQVLGRCFKSFLTSSSYPNEKRRSASSMINISRLFLSTTF